MQFLSSIDKKNEKNWLKMNFTNLNPAYFNDS